MEKFQIPGLAGVAKAVTTAVLNSQQQACDEKGKKGKREEDL